MRRKRALIFVLWVLYTYNIVYALCTNNVFNRLMKSTKKFVTKKKKKKGIFLFQSRLETACNDFEHKKYL